MRGAAPRRWPAAVFAAVLTVVPAAAFANPVSADDPPLLDVPYLAQPPELCGVAAVSMVLRYWGARDVFPEDFRALVESS